MTTVRGACDKAARTVFVELERVLRLQLAVVAEVAAEREALPVDRDDGAPGTTPDTKPPRCPHQLAALNAHPLELALDDEPASPPTGPAPRDKAARDLLPQDRRRPRSRRDDRGCGRVSCASDEALVDCRASRRCARPIASFVISWRRTMRRTGTVGFSTSSQMPGDRLAFRSSSVCEHEARRRSSKSFFSSATRFFLSGSDDVEGPEPVGDVDSRAAPTSPSCIPPGCRPGALGHGRECGPLLDSTTKSSPR